MYLLIPVTFKKIFLVILMLDVSFNSAVVFFIPDALFLEL
jgi:hypothetical protein